MSFKQFNLAQPLLMAISEQGYTTPSPIQQQAIPVVLSGKDLLASAQTGTGKTAAFALPIIHRLAHSAKKMKARHTAALILVPTRELAIQVHANILQYTKHLSLRAAVVYGGVKINPQISTLQAGVEILVATPGRLIDLHRQGAVQFDALNTLVLDEADRMLDMGFIHDIKRILAVLPRTRQNLLFSATFSNDIRALAKQWMNHPTEVSVSPANAAATPVTQLIHPVDKARKAALLCHLIQKKNWQQALVFSRTKHGANKLVRELNAANITALAIHGNKSQAQRVKALQAFKEEEIRILVATDIAARGLDIPQMPVVVNFDLPQVAHDYVHRIGRTGRAQSKGLAVSLVCADEFEQLQSIEKVINRKIQQTEIDEFEPTHSLPTKIKTHSPPAPRKAKTTSRFNTRKNGSNSPCR